MKEPITIKFNGKTYRRYPEAENRAHRVYFQRFDTKKRSAAYLHRDIWEFHNGPIPEGYHIHHKDKNSFNNNIDNLVCLTPKEHSAEHSEEYQEAMNNYYKTPEWEEHYKKFIEARDHWIETHKEEIAARMKRQWAEAERTDCPCSECGIIIKRFFPNRGKNHFCSKRCWARFHWESVKERYNEERVCQHCGKTFTTRKRAKTKTCSMSCSAKLRYKNYKQES